MESYGDLLEDDDDHGVFDEIAQLAFDAGRGAAVLEAQEANSSDYWGGRIVAAANKRASKDLWEPVEDEQ